ncbi:hypothetical protein GTQ43_23495 [Nostoc sp. KVJ3]|nr:hypothetical protein [Nostoc sp. KVJ3]MCW5316672.1 hypothetical protein [Nostoc sp. KVJ3]
MWSHCGGRVSRHKGGITAIACEELEHFELVAIVNGLIEACSHERLELGC